MSIFAAIFLVVIAGLLFWGGFTIAAFVFAVVATIAIIGAAA